MKTKKEFFFDYIEDILCWVVVIVCGTIMIVREPNIKQLYILLPLILPIVIQALNVILKNKIYFTLIQYISIFLILFWQPAVNGMLYFGLMFSSPLLHLTISSLLVLVLLFIKLIRTKSRPKKTSNVVVE